jgi:hypothetical protein
MHVTPDSVFVVQLLSSFSANEAKFRKRSQGQKINEFNAGR